MAATFTDDILKCIFLNENIRILIQFSLKFVPNGPIDNIPAIGLDNGLAPKRWQAIIWTNADPVHRCIYAALGGGELIQSYSVYLSSFIYYVWYESRG